MLVTHCTSVDYGGLVKPHVICGGLLSAWIRFLPIGEIRLCVDPCMSIYASRLQVGNQEFGPLQGSSVLQDKLCVAVKSRGS